MNLIPTAPFWLATIGITRNGVHPQIRLRVLVLSLNVGRCGQGRRRAATSSLAPAHMGLLDCRPRGGEVSRTWADGVDWDKRTIGPWKSPGLIGRSHRPHMVESQSRFRNLRSHSDSEGVTSRRFDVFLTGFQSDICTTSCISGEQQTLCPQNLSEDQMQSPFASLQTCGAREGSIRFSMSGKRESLIFAGWKAPCIFRWRRSQRAPMSCRQINHW